MTELLGTSHVSEESADKVRDSIEEGNPDVVGVELDEERYEKLMGDDEIDVSEEDIKNTIKGKGSSKFLVNVLMQYFQGSMGKEMGMKPGEDMKTAVKTAEENDIDVALIDRDLKVTMGRFMKNLNIFGKFKLVAIILFSLVVYSFSYMKMLIFNKIGINVDDNIGNSVDNELERMKGDPDDDVVVEYVEELKATFPSLYEVLIDERDRYMASEIKELEEDYDEVYAVVGAGHKQGIQDYLNMGSIPEIKEFNKRFDFSILKFIGIMVPVSILSMFFFLYMAGVDSTILLTIGGLWVIVNGIPAFTMTYAAGGKLHTSLIGGSIAWFSSLNPLLAPGWIVGYFELKYHNISGDDLNDIRNIVSEPPEESLKGNLALLQEIPTFRILTIVASTNIGSLIGTAMFFVVVLPLMSLDVDLTQSILEGMNNTVSILF